MPNPTSNLALPNILAAQAQKHVTHNDALRLLDGMVQIGVISRVLAAPPGAPVDGDRYIVASGATGLWAGWDLNVAFWTDGAWMRLVPQIGWIAWSAADAALYVWTGSVWAVATGGGVADGDKGAIIVSGGGAVWTIDPAANVQVNRIGVGGAVPDATNRVSINTPAVLLNNAGTSMQMTINKNSAAADALLVFQTGFSTRAIFGTGGSDDFTLKVSPDGSSFCNALTAIRETGKLRADLALQLNPAAGDLSAPVDGDLWYNSTSGKFRGRQAGSTVDLVGAGGGGVTDGDKGDISVSGGGTDWRLDDAVKSGFTIAMRQCAFSY